MNKSLKASAYILFCLMSANLQAVTISSTVYGEINVSYDFRDSAEDDWFSNASRLGIKGDYEVSDKSQLIYQFEQQIDYAHGGKDEKTLFSMRNSFIGVKGSYGSLMWGVHDTPFKKAQGKVDIFNDQAGDIKSLVVGEIRSTDSFMYHSPLLSDHFLVKVMHVPSDSHFESGQSISLNYKTDNWDTFVSVDSNMRKNDRSATSTKVYDSVRGAVQYTTGKWKLGALIQQSERQNVIGADKETGYVLSSVYRHGNWAFLFLHGQSDIIQDDRESNQLGIDYYFAKKSKVYVYLWELDTPSGTYRVSSAGIEIKF